MNYWLEADPDEILDEIIHARQLAGEDLDETSGKVRAMVRRDIASSQKDISMAISETDCGLAVFRAMTLRPDDLDGFEARGLGDCWAFDRLGAFTYDGRRSDTEIIIEARVSPDDVVWPMVIGMWSSGEGEARLDARANVTINEMRTRNGDPVREDLGSILVKCWQLIVALDRGVLVSRSSDIIQLF